MKLYRSLFLILVVMLLNSAANSQSKDVELLLRSMTLEEKVGQMTQLNLDVVCVGGIYQLEEPHRLDQEKLRIAIEKYHVGSILNCGGHAYPREQWLSIMKGIHDASAQYGLKVPVFYGIDAIHGANYVMGSILFPQPLAQAATFNPSMARQAAEITAYETRAAGIPWNFSPVLDVMRNPTWSRCFETYGEDVRVVSEFGSATILGYQGSGAMDDYHVAACLKHFLGYSAARTGKDRTPAFIPNNTLREIYLPPFKRAIREGAKTVMINSGEINGIPVHASKEILTDLLRTELGFQGIAVTDWEDVMKLELNHHVAKDLKEAVFIAVNAGIDMCMVPNDYRFTELLIELVKEGRISEERINTSVLRILNTKEQMGMLKSIKVPSLADYPNFGSESSRSVATKIAEQSITLLENKNNALPLPGVAKIFVTGPAAHSMTLLNGAWTRTWQGVDEKWDDQSRMTIREAMEAKKGWAVRYEKGCELEGGSIDKNALMAASESDYIVFCAGELPSTEIPGNISELDLPAVQQEYFKALSALGKKIILVLVENRPRIVRELVPLADAVVMAYLPGDQGGEALVNILSGKVNPSGRLPFTYPRHNQDLLTYDHKYTEQFDTQFGKNGYNPQWPFGHGLSYTTVSYSDMKVSAERVVSFKVKNTGTKPTEEVAILYISDLVATVTPSVKRVADFKRIPLSPGEEKEVVFQLTKEQFSFCMPDGTWVVEPGEFVVSAGNISAKFEINK